MNTTSGRKPSQKSREKKKIAFVLSGGANRGALEVGALLALLEHDIRPQILIGTSGGGHKCSTPCHQSHARRGTLAGEDMARSFRKYSQP